MSLRKKLILSICLPLLALYAAVLGWDYSQSRHQAMEQAQQLVAERAGNAAAQLNGRLLTMQQTIDSAAGMLTNQQQITESQTRDVLRWAMRPSWIEDAWIAFSATATRASNIAMLPMVRRSRMGPPGEPRQGGGPGSQPGPRGPNLPAMEVPLTKPAAEQPWYAIVRETHKGTWFDPDDFAEPDGGKSVIYSAPFYTTAGEFAGVVCGSLRVDDLQYLREDPPSFRGRRGSTTTPSASPNHPAPLALGQGGYVLLDRKRELLSHPDNLVFSKPRDRREGDPRFGELREAVAEASAGRGRVVNVADMDEMVSGFTPGEVYMLALEPIRTTGWVYLTAVPRSQLMGPVQYRLIQRGAVLIASVFVLGGFVTLLITRFCRPIEKMAGRVEQLARGQLQIDPIPVHSNDEIGRLARGFNTMTTQLKRHIDELTEQSAARERVEGELRIARQIQTDLLPRIFPPFPERKEFELHAVNIPARYIAGDFFDFFFSSPDVLTVVIADVSGKGIPAALVMAVTRTVIRNLAHAGVSPHEIAERANRVLVEDTRPGLFVTMILGQYKPATGEFTFVNAGHPYAIRYSSLNGTDAVRECPPTAPLMGVVLDGSLGPIEEQSITLQVGEGLLFYTDGVTEAADASGILYGESRLTIDVGKRRTSRPLDLCDGVVRDVMDYQHNTTADDVTLVSLQRRA